MLKTEPSDAMRSAGIVMDEDLFDALDEIREMMTENGVMPSRSEIARTLLWSSVAIIRSRNPQVGKLLRAVADAEDAWSSASVSEPAR